MIIFVKTACGEIKKMAVFYFQSPDNRELFVKTRTGKVVGLSVESNDSIEVVKQKIQDKEGCPPNLSISLFGGGFKLKNFRDSAKVYECCIIVGHVGAINANIEQYTSAISDLQVCLEDGHPFSKSLIPGLIVNETSISEALLALQCAQDDSVILEFHIVLAELKSSFNTYVKKLRDLVESEVQLIREEIAKQMSNLSEFEKVIKKRNNFPEFLIAELHRSEISISDRIVALECPQGVSAVGVVDELRYSFEACTSKLRELVARSRLKSVREGNDKSARLNKYQKDKQNILKWQNAKINPDVAKKQPVISLRDAPTPGGYITCIESRQQAAHFIQANPVYFAVYQPLQFSSTVLGVFSYTSVASSVPVVITYNNDAAEVLLVNHGIGSALVVRGHIFSYDAYFFAETEVESDCVIFEEKLLLKFLMLHRNHIHPNLL